MNMIDTVILNIPQTNVRVVADGNARPWDLHSKSGIFAKYTKNPPRGLKDGIYRPRLTGMVRSVGRGQKISFLKIEFSAPKLIYNNNLDELVESDFGRVIETLYKRLTEVGVVINKVDLRQATVAAFHPSKNIVLVDGYTASFVAHEISKINLNLKFGLQKTSFRNGGQSLQGYTQAHAIVLYDKIADLAQPKKRAIDKDQTPIQLSIFEHLREIQPSLEVLRLEIRLTQKQKINGLFRKLDLPIDPTFEQVFRKNVCQKVVRFYWDTMVEGENLFLFGIECSAQNLLKRLLRDKALRPKEAVYLIGLNELCKDEGGIRTFRTVIEKRLSRRGWYRFAIGIKQINGVRKSAPMHGWVLQVRSALKRFEAYRVRSP